MAKNSIIQKLPLDPLQDPDREAIQATLRKKVQIFRRLKVSSIIGFIVSILGFCFFANIDSKMKGIPLIVTLGDFTPFLVFLFLAIALHFQEKRYNLTDSEIDLEIEKYKSKQKVPA